MELNTDRTQIVFRYTKGIPIQSLPKPIPNTIWYATTFPRLVSLVDDLSANKHFKVAFGSMTIWGKIIAC